MSSSVGNRLIALLARDWSAIALGALIFFVTCIALSMGSRGWVPVSFLVVGAALISGGLVHVARLLVARKRFPAPGRFVDVDGTLIHVLAEGEHDESLPVVMFGGGHSAGIVMYHLHNALRDVTRSILIDRPGTGWSDTGPFPRTTAREALEMITALERAGEMGPFCLVGYSFGGLLAANIARRRPDLVARLILLDATPLETLVFGPRLGAIGSMRSDALKGGLARLIGFDVDFQLRRAVKAGNDPTKSAIGRALGSNLTTLRGIEKSAGSRFADWSILRELEGPHIARCGWETIVYDGDLGAMSVWVVAPANAAEVVDAPEIERAHNAEQHRMVQFFERTRERYLAVSSDARRVYAPPGSTHQFVFEHPDFVIDLLRDAVRYPCRLTQN